jgi:transcriptional regulator with XRE-family HTH domain
MSRQVTPEILRARARIVKLLQLTEILARPSEVGQRLQIARLRLGISEQEAAAAAKVTVKTWRKYEAGGGGHCTIPIVNFGVYFGVSLDWLFDDGLITRVCDEFDDGDGRAPACRRPRLTVVQGGAA